MEFLVEFEIEIPHGTPASEIEGRERAEASAAAQLAADGHLLRVWKRTVTRDETRILGLYHADSRPELDGLLAALPLADWMRIAVTPLEPHPNDPGAAVAGTADQPS